MTKVFKEWVDHPPSVCVEINACGENLTASVLKSGSSDISMQLNVKSKRCASSTLFQIHQENNDVFLQSLILGLDEPLWSFLELIRGGLVLIQTTEIKTKPRVHLQDWNLGWKVPQSKLCFSKGDARGQVPASHLPGRHLLRAPDPVTKMYGWWFCALPCYK